MNKQARDQFEEQEINESLTRYEAMLDSGLTTYFDVFQFEHIIEFFLDEDDPESAFQAVEMGLSMHPSSISLQIYKCQLLLSLDDYLLAGEMAGDLLKIEDTNAELHLVKGSSLLMQEHDELAQEHFDTAIYYSSGSLDETYFHIGYSYEQREMYTEALRYLEEAYKLNPGHDGTLYELAYCYEKMGEDEKSLEFYDKFLDIDPFSDSAWFNVGIVHNKLERTEEAVEAYEYALALNDEFGNAYFNLGHSYLSLNQPIRAIESYEAYLKFEPENDEVIAIIGECYQRMGNFEKAFDQFDKALKINIQNAYTWYAYGLLNWAAGKQSEARNCYRQATNLDSENAEFWHQLAISSKVLNFIDEAADAYQHACEIAPQVVDYWLSYSDMLNKRGMVIRAIEVLEEAVNTIPDEPMFHYYLCAYNLEKEYHRKARTHLKKALQKDPDGILVLFDIFPDAMFDEQIHKLIQEYKNNEF
jgi:tetratricopeptide (TPR) repeat protein